MKILFVSIKYAITGAFAIARCLPVHEHVTYENCQYIESWTSEPLDYALKIEGPREENCAVKYRPRLLVN